MNDATQWFSGMLKNLLPFTSQIMCTFNKAACLNLPDKCPGDDNILNINKRYLLTNQLSVLSRIPLRCVVYSLNVLPDSVVS